MSSEQKSKGHVTETPDTSHIKNVDVTHETSDVQVGSIAKFVVGLFVLTVATYVVLWGMFVFLERNELKIEQQHPRPPMALSGDERMPPEPRLQSAPGFGAKLEHEAASSAEKHEAKPTPSPSPKDPLWEIDVLNKQWRDTLEHGPVDEHGKRYGMPIEKAKEEVLKQGLPVREQKAESRRQ